MSVVSVCKIFGKVRFVKLLESVARCWYCWGEGRGGELGSPNVKPRLLHPPPHGPA